MAERELENPHFTEADVQQDTSYEMAVEKLAEIDFDTPVYVVRGQNILLDQDVARLYEVETSVLIRAVRRHIDHFPVDFLFKLTPDETKAVQAYLGQDGQDIHRDRSTPYAFTEMGVAMAAQVLNSARALHINVTIMRDFIRLRRLCGTNVELLEKLDAMDAKYDLQFKKMIAALEALQGSVKDSHRRVGFHVS